MTVSPQQELSVIVELLNHAHKSFAVVGGLAVSVRAEVRFTRDVDIVVVVDDDADAKSLIHTLTRSGYVPLATVEHESQKRLATARLNSAHGVVVDLIFASSGIEPEIVDRATEVVIEGIGKLYVARAEELLSMKILSMSSARLQDTIDAQNILAFNPGLDLDAVRGNLIAIENRGYARGENLMLKLDSILQSLPEEE